MHGGSGLNFNARDVSEMDLDQIEFYMDWLEERRNAEAAAIKKANSKPG